MTFYIQNDASDCLIRIPCTLSFLFTYCLVQNELKHGALVQWPIITTAIYKRNTVNKEMLISKNSFAPIKRFAFI